MTTGRYAVGFAALVVVCVAVAVTAVSLRARLLAGWEGARARLAEFVLGLAALIAILEVLGAVGLFRLVPIVAACVLAAIAARLWSARAPVPAAAPRASPLSVSPPRGSLRAMVAVAMVAAAAVIAEWAIPTLNSYDAGIRSLDSLWYHLPWAASFAQTGRITTLRFTDVEYLTAFYPATAELAHGLGIVLLGRDTLSPAINLGWLSLTLLAAWCIGSPRGLGPATLTGAALALATPMIRISQGGTAANDIVGVFFLLAAVALVMNAGLREREDAPGVAPAPGGSQATVLAIAAVSAGLAVSVKLSLLAPVLALTVGTIAIAGRGRRRPAAMTWIAALVLAGGYWYVRNLLAVGNPLPWAGLGILPTPAAPLQQSTGFSFAHYVADTHLWSRFFAPGLASGLGPWWVLVIAAAIAGPLFCVLGGDGRGPARAARWTGSGPVRMLGLVALVSLAAYVITPETAAGPAGDPSGFAFNLRYAAPGLTMALAVTPLATWLGGARARLGTLAVLVALLAVTLAESRLWNGDYASGAVLVGAVALAALTVAGGLARLRVTRALAVPAAIVALLALAVAGYAGQRHYLRGRYAFRRGVSSLSTLWVWARHVRDARIGLVGTFGGFFSYPLLGLDDSNRVQYVAQRGPHGSFTPIRTCRAWRTAVDDGHYRYLVATPARDPWHPAGLEYSPEARWTASDPAARVVFRHVAHGKPILVFELTGRLSANDCPG